ncbi:GNAT family N-acetyltransferase [Chitinophaga sp. GCM10012297]|uniref:GNAT family N-acetyltransferase n=1 Tax=Chitinophaga chungangae TaxID=2821488 RepID=A0ABS3YFT1_9BACT|nr:GNAT family N-acetyltransferase [Chitinophaga chungangae]MBO9153538.1 GNAT family N-acetyltransferase [Chitinophaga chungangae]
MPLREATIDDIPALHNIRMAVRENVLHSPGLATTDDYARYLTTDGKGWLFEERGEIKGFAIVNTRAHEVWAMFVHPDAEGRGIGAKLHDALLEWYFEYFEDTLRLGTMPGTRAEQFYLRKGWKKQGGIRMNGEIRFTMSVTDYEKM